MSSATGEQLIATILKHDSKSTSYKLALLRALNDVVLTVPDAARHQQDVAVPLRSLAEWWVAYYWPFMDQEQPVYQGGRAERAGVIRNDVGFRPALTHLRQVWQQDGQLSALPADGFFLVSEMRTPRRRTTYALVLQQAYEEAIRAIMVAITMPIRYAGEGQWSVFAKPLRQATLPATVWSLPGTQPTDSCVVVPTALWQAFSRLSLYVEALSLHEWSLFTEGVTQNGGTICSRGTAYTLLTARPDNRRSLTWERNQVDVLLLEKVRFTCPWTQKLLTQPSDYDLDHLLPLTVYPINELWNLLPVDRQFNQHVKRDRVPSAERLTRAEPFLAATYEKYQQLPTLQRAVREDASLRFTGLPATGDFSRHLAYYTVRFIEDVAQARFVTRF
jgi:hypothetical protein